MADTQRSVSDILTVLADNNSGQISPQDLRDGFVTWRLGYAQLYMAEGAEATVTIASTAAYYEVTGGTWTLTAGGLYFDESAGNGRLTYTGDADVLVYAACMFSVNAASNNVVTHWMLGLNGVQQEESEVHRYISTGADVGAAAVHGLFQLSTGHYLSMFARNATSATNLQMGPGTFIAITMPV
jgi:hypothetical protein